MFDVQLEGRTVLDQFDAYARAGPNNTPIVWTETVTVTDGILEIRFTTGPWIRGSTRSR